jgi:internalin A
VSFHSALESLDVSRDNVRGTPGTQVTDAGLKEIARLTNLTSLDLRATGITDAGLKDLVKLKLLFMLNLSSTQVTDTGILCIGKLKSLRDLGLWYSQVTESGVAALRRVLPRCQISHSHAQHGET